MDSIFDFQKVLFSLYGAHDSKSVEFQLLDKRAKDRLFTRLEHARSLDGALEVNQNVIDHNGSLSFGYDGRRVVLASEMGEVRSFYPAQVQVTVDPDPRDSYIFIEGPPLYRGGDKCWMTICANESSLARTGAALRDDTQIKQKNAEEWRQGIKKRIETHVLQKLQRHYQLARVYQPHFTFEGEHGNFGGNGLNASEWMSVEFLVKNSSGMKPEKTIDTVRTFFRYQVPLPHIMYERKQTRKILDFSALIHIPE